MHLIEAGIVSSFLVAGILAGAGYAQEAQSPRSATSSNPAATAPTQQVSSSDGRVILKVGTAEVTQEEFDSRIRDLEPQGGDSETEKGRRRLGDDYASVLMLSQQAVATHLDSSPEVIRKLAINRIQVLSDAEFASLMRQADPTKEEISKYYSEHLADYDQVRVRRLFIWKRRDDAKDGPVLSSQAARARADQIRQAYASGTDPRKLSADLSKSGEGLLDPEPLTFSRGELSPQMEKMAFALQQGEWSEVEDSPARLLLMQLVKRDRRPLEQVSSRIEKNLQDDKMESLLDDMKKKAGIWMDEQYFGTAVAPVQGAQRRTSNPPSEPGKSDKKGENTNENESRK
jgi:hypothetical protein